MTLRLAYFVATCRPALAGHCGATAFSPLSTSARGTTVSQSAGLAAAHGPLWHACWVVLTCACGVARCCGECGFGGDRSYGTEDSGRISHRELGHSLRSRTFRA